MKYCLLVCSLLCALSVSAQENTGLLCADGIDNDGDGLIDCEDGDCFDLENTGCETCTEGISFADEVIEYVSGCPLADPDPTGALGVADFKKFVTDESLRVFLGLGGHLKLGFTNNILTNSGTPANDLFVFEVGDLVEACDIEVRPANASTTAELLAQGITDPDNDGFYPVGSIGGSTAGLDLDAALPGYAPGVLQFDAVMIIDDPSGSCNNATTPGADIDAVCALSSIFLDCNSVLNGTAVLDQCGVCLEPDDPEFNASCADCAGTPNGAAIIDDCGDCFEPTDSLFNAACTDCNGVFLGPALLDDCGICLLPTDPTFSRGCLTPDFFVPNAFSPNDDGINDRLRAFRGFGSPTVSVQFQVFGRWGELVYAADFTDFDQPQVWWDGRIGDVPAPIGVYVYALEVILENGETAKLGGDVLLIR